MTPGELKEFGEGLLDVNDFVLRNREQYPELDNFLGFGEFDGHKDVDMQERAGQDDSKDQSVFGYKKHMELSDILMGVKEGKYF